jgi:hypothetical protein
MLLLIIRHQSVQAAHLLRLPDSPGFSNQIGVDSSWQSKPLTVPSVKPVAVDAFALIPAPSVTWLSYLRSFCHIQIYAEIASWDRFENVDLCSHFHHLRRRVNGVGLAHRSRESPSHVTLAVLVSQPHDPAEHKPVRTLISPASRRSLRLQPARGLPLVKAGIVLQGIIRSRPLSRYACYGFATVSDSIR